MCYPYNMKNSLKNYIVWLIAIGLSIISIGVPYLVLYLTYKNPQPFVYPLLHLAIAGVYILAGFISGDVVIISWRQKNKNWNDDLPPEIKQKAWNIRMPFYISAAFTFTVFLVSQAYYLIIGHYPFI